MIMSSFSFARVCGWPHNTLFNIFLDLGGGGTTVSVWFNKFAQRWKHRCSCQSVTHNTIFSAVIWNIKKILEIVARPHKQESHWKMTTFVFSFLSIFILQYTYTNHVRYRRRLLPNSPHTVPLKWISWSICWLQYTEKEREILASYSSQALIIHFSARNNRYFGSRLEIYWIWDITGSPP